MTGGKDCCKKKIMARGAVKAADWLKARCAWVPLNSCLIRGQYSSTLTFDVMCKRKMEAIFAGDCVTVHQVLNGSQCRQIKKREEK